MGWIGCVCCEKFLRDFVARTFALLRPVLHRVSKGNQTVPNATKWYETHENVSLGSNGVDRVRSLRKCTQTVRNAPKRQFWVQRGGSGAFVATNSDPTLWHELLHYVGPFCTEFRKATKRFRMHPNIMKRTKT